MCCLMTTHAKIIFSRVCDFRNKNKSPCEKCYRVAVVRKIRRGQFYPFGLWVSGKLVLLCCLGSNLRWWYMWMFARWSSVGCYMVCSPSRTIFLNGCLSVFYTGVKLNSAWNVFKIMHLFTFLDGCSILYIIFCLSLSLLNFIGCLHIAATTVSPYQLHLRKEFSDISC